MDDASDLHATAVIPLALLRAADGSLGPARLEQNQGSVAEPHRHMALVQRRRLLSHAHVHLLVGPHQQHLTARERLDIPQRLTAGHLRHGFLFQARYLCHGFPFPLR
jgi:hypothetical protein